MRIVVTGAAGFIGSNLVRALNAVGHTRIIAVDALTDGEKLQNLRDCTIEDYLDHQDFLRGVVAGRFGPKIEAVLHQGACSDTMESDWRFMLENNHRYTLALLDWTQSHGAPLLYASTAAVYGASAAFAEESVNERPLNVYGWSKLLVDQTVRRLLAEGNLRAPVVGLRYFNVYGPGETYKCRMASVAWQLYHQLRREGHARLFEGSHGCANGEQQRDFVWIGDIVAANLHFLGGDARSGVYNVGSGTPCSFNALALTLVNALRRRSCKAAMTLGDAVTTGTLRYTPFPDGLRDRYQAYTCADLTRIRAAGFNDSTSVEDGVDRFVGALLEEAP